MLRMMMLRRRTDGRTRTHTLRESSQSKCTWTFPTSHFMRKFTVKMPGPRPGTTVCESLHSRNAFGHFTIAISRGNSEVKRRQQAPGFTPTVRSPQCGHTVWRMNFNFNDIVGGWKLVVSTSHIYRLFRVPTKCFASETVASC